MVREVRLSPFFADLHGIAPLLIQAGSHEVLLDDATRLAATAATADVAVQLDVTPAVPHVFPSFAGLLDEGEAALARAGGFLRAASSRPPDQAPPERTARSRRELGSPGSGDDGSPERVGHW
jgi:epsilon-lactone hydrolase